MSYKNKTYIAFASEDIHLYRLMEAWRENEKIDFDFLMLMTSIFQEIVVSLKPLKETFVRDLKTLSK